MSNIFGYIRESINEGEGLRSVIFFSGCHGLCEGCHNPESWEFNHGVELTNTLQQKIVREVGNNPLLDGVTLCGGEPFLNTTAAVNLIKNIRSVRPDINFWSYTGYTYEDILLDEDKYVLLKEIDVLIDGEFINSKKDLTLKFRGSSNQRVINVQESIKADKVVLLQDF